LIIFDIISAFLLTILLFWTVYNGSIIYVGIRNNRKKAVAPPPRDLHILPSYSFIVPTKNEETVIRRCLDGILNIDYPREKVQIIVVDGQSTDNTLKICSEFEHNYPETFKVISEKTTSGKPAALNLALPYTTGELIAVFDADSFPERDVLTKVTSYFSDPTIQAIQGRTTSINEKSSILTRVIAMEERAWFQMLLSGRERLHLFVPLNGSCQFIRRTVLSELNGWDEQSLTEDVEFAVRLVEKKHLVKYAPDVCSGQETPNALNSLIKQRIRWYRGYMETALKYGRLLDNINKKTVDAEISLGGPFMMIVSLLSYINWFFIAILFSQSTFVLDFTGLVIVLTAVSLISIGIAVTASERPIKLRNILWIPAVYVYWLLQMFIAGWAFLMLIFRRKRDWTKTVKSGSIVQSSKKGLFS
jgi:cellulose synthase/poly-beta-1,6-N-acetylglucosamine synthase-like glycosyltransferase